MYSTIHIVVTSGGYGDCEMEILDVYTTEEVANKHAARWNKNHKGNWTAEVREFIVRSKLAEEE